jgi:hypothetical protein
MRPHFFQRETILQVPGCTLLRENAEITPEEILAEEDFHHGNRKWLINDKVNKDDKTICTSNVPDETAAPDKSICHGPLIFDPSPPIAEDKDVPLAAADDQAELMQWHYRLGHLSFQKAEAACPQWQDTQEIVEAQAPQVRWLSIWRDDQVTLARQRVSTFSPNLSCHQARGDSLSRPNGIDRGGLFCPVEGVSHQEAVQILHCFCRLLLSILFCAPPN